MKKEFPATRLTQLAALQTRSMNPHWEQSWEEFFKAYYDGITTCVENAFFRKGWKDVSPADVDDVAAHVVDAIYKDGEFIELDFAKGRFRQMLAVICQRRVVDFIRARQKDRNNVPADVVLGDPALVHDQHQALEDESFFEAFAEVLLAELQHEVSPQTLQIFERVKLLGEEANTVAQDLGVKRGVIDNSILKAKQKCREILQRDKISKEFTF